ncbi:MAG: hypothetical protein HUU20_10075 [Pirellulales bacterium]|nr:hypothetical protein [Pirellulales bacterium]
MLNDEAKGLWDEYLVQERRGVGSSVLPALENFIEALERIPADDRSSWALSTAAEAVDGKRKVPVRLPLFQKVLFPALLSGYRKRTPGCARWLAGLAPLLHDSPECRDQLGSEESPELGWLRVASEVDPGNTREWGGLIRMLSELLGYAIHEVPRRVLFGPREATIADCDQLLDELEHFCGLTTVRSDGRIDPYRDLIDDCRMHFLAYRDFLSNRHRYADYAQFLEQMNDTDDGDDL